MNKILLGLESPTKAIKAKNALHRSGIQVKIIKIDGGEIGCKHGVEIDESDLISGIDILRRNNIKYTMRSNNGIS